ncbi:hypothetical protein A2Z23_02150 [Candidatus Curtissbacteria bacterium RBG_16_39_7]|uniref:Uncharacterized protein n=1 Tax=Candidatus Curtissbacteria bacterium RBG_16_39_7 TaxID=1797707 RepID=A0A1F5G1X3_9BACT|nr:MAG: hypothetical protein A2Z23_02150 [Candidatus Curtissbacteria bacterium RBG_16_39_7]
MPDREKPRGETHTLAVVEISPFTLSQFIQRQEAISEFHLKLKYAEIFSALRTLPFSQQEELLVSFFTRKVENFPNGEKLGHFLTKINNIGWFEPQEEPDHETLQKLSDEFYSRQNLNSLPLKIIKGDWPTAWSLQRDIIQNPIWFPTRNVSRATALDLAKIMAHDMVWNETFNETWNQIRKKISNVTKTGSFDVANRIVQDAVNAAEWIVLEDLIPQKGYNKGNPFELLFDGINDKGYWFVGPVKGRSVIFVPEIRSEISKRLELECFSGRGYQGSEEEYEKFLSQIPFKDPVRFYISRDLRLDENTDYYTDSGNIIIYSTDELGKVKEELSGAQENYYVSIQLLGEDGKPVTFQTAPHTWVSPSWGFYLKPTTESVGTFVRLIFGEESS